tara:strand:+ start:3680 stop:3892 length:213 start_codon:yes stop_codon:yes gene_type:complete
MAISDDQTMLTNVNTAINAILSGAQHYAIGDKQVTSADLKFLYSMRKDLEERIARNEGGVLVTGVGISHG